MATYLVDTHGIKEYSACRIQNDPMFDLKIKLAKDRIKKILSTGDSGKKYYAATGQDYPNKLKFISAQLSWY